MSAAGHWKHQRLTALVNFPLMLWLAWSVVHMLPLSYMLFRGWLAQPLHAVLMTAALLSVFYHAALGTQVIAEDYIHAPGTLKSTLSALRLYFAGAGLLCIAAVAKIAFTGS